jgi:tetratricopeptide (TPR) repeat protein
MRDFLFAIVLATVERCSDSEDPGAALETSALLAANQLLAEISEPEDDLEIAHLVGWLHWYRFLALGQEDGEQDFNLALRLLYPVYQASPDTVPALVRTFFETTGHIPGSEPSDEVSEADELADQGLSQLGIALRTGGLSELNQAVESLQGALDKTPRDYPGRAGWLTNLGTALRARFEHDGQPADLEAAIAASRDAVALTSAGHPDRAATLTNLGAALNARFRYAHDLADLDDAIAASRESLAEVPADHPSRNVVLSILSGALLTRFRETSAPEDLAEAVTMAREAVRQAPDGDPSRAGNLAALGSALLTRYEQTGNPADLDEAIASARSADEALPEGHPNRTRLLSNLGAALATRFGQTGNLSDLNAAITAHGDAVDAAPADDPVKPEMLLNLGTSLAMRYGHTGDLTDLDLALSAMREGIEAAPAAHAILPTMRFNLSVALHMRYERAGARADLDASVDAVRKALDATGPGHPHRPAMLSGLSSALRMRFGLDTDLADLHESVRKGRESVDILPASHPDRGPTSSNLGAALTVRYQQTGRPDDLKAAIAAYREAIDATSPDQPNRAMMLGNLGDSLVAGFEQTGDRANLTAAIEAKREAAAVTGAQPWMRAGAARGWGWAAGVLEDWPDAVRGFEKAADLLGLIAPRSLDRSDQEHLLEGLDGMAGQAAACCVRAGQPDRAIELLEQARGILLSQALDTRTDLAELTDHHRDLADRFVRLRDALDRPDALSDALAAGPPGPPSGRASAEARRRRGLARDFDQLLAEIRRRPNFKSFLRPPPVSELTAAAAEGPVVIVNASRFGSHALVLTNTGLLEPLPLPELTVDSVVDQVTEFVTVVSGDASPAEQLQLTAVLGWLWDAIAGPILEHLGIHGRPESSVAWPRLWWCAPGLLSFLPLHAAGHHDTRSEASPRTVADRVISSYTPTVRALVHARRRPAAQSGTTEADAADIAVIAMPHTPGERALRGAMAEAQLLDRLFPSRTDTYVGAEAIFGKVTQAMAATRWAHFACHGAVDPASPSDGRLLLHDHQHRPLTVADVARLRLDNAEFAFLSACTTARPDDRLTDEAIHLASAFQLAGYRQVIGTLWPINDRIAVKIADAVYQSLATGGEPAAALHSATRRIRDEWPDLPFRWAAHIHVGP